MFLVSGDSYLYAVAAASVVLTVDITKRRLKKVRTWVRPLLRIRLEVGTCDLLLPELRATDTQMCANFTRVSQFVSEFDFLCSIREQITGSGRWHRPIPPPARVTSTSGSCKHRNMLMSLKYFTTAFILFYCIVIAATSAHLQ